MTVMCASSASTGHGFPSMRIMKSEKRATKKSFIFSPSKLELKYFMRLLRDIGNRFAPSGSLFPEEEEASAGIILNDFSNCCD